MVLQREPQVSHVGHRGLAADVLSGAIALCLVAAAAITADYLNGVSPEKLQAGPAGVHAIWLPHVTRASLFAVLIALAVVLYGPTLVRRLSWPAALFAGYVGSVGFTFCMALVDGWRTGFAERLVAVTEYLHQVPSIQSIPRMLTEFTSRVPLSSEAPWTTHIAGHPPGATLLFVWLDRLGLDGGEAAATFCVLVGSLVAVAVPVTMRVLGSDELGRATLPFVVLFPGAVWMGVSADAAFAGITASGVALLALGAARSPGAAWLALAGGLLLGYGVFCSYGMVLLGPLALFVVLWQRNWRALGFGLLGALLVLAAFTAAGFWWYEGYQVLVERYYQGPGLDRSYAFWVWANLSSLVLAAGPVLAPALRRAVVGVRHAVAQRRGKGPGAGGTADTTALAGVAGTVLAAALAVLVADLSGLSKAEVERIWLPFAIWLCAGAALLPSRYHRPWLAVQALTALLVNHLLLTSW